MRMAGDTEGLDVRAESTRAPDRGGDRIMPVAPQRGLTPNFERRQTVTVPVDNAASPAAAAAMA